MSYISIEFCLVTFLLLTIFITNLLHILYLIIYKHKPQIKSIRSILINSSLSSIIVAIWIIPLFYFRTLWPSESFLWRLWSFLYHVIDSVQLYSLLLIISIRSYERIFIVFSWLIPLFAYSPILWLNSSHNDIDYLPYRRLMQNIPWWILPIVYFTMYIVPIVLSIVFNCINVCWPWAYSYYKKQNFKNGNYNRPYTEHDQDMIELTNLIDTVFNFKLEQTKSQTNTLKSLISSFEKHKSNEYSPVLSYSICPHHLFDLFDELSISPLIHSSSKQRKVYFQQPFDSCLLLIITCLLLLVHLPYILLSFLDKLTLQLSLFIYVHWLGTLFLPLIHIK